MNLNKGNDPNAAFQQYSIAYINIIKPAGVLVGVRQYKPKKTCPNPGASVVVVLWAPLPCYGWENNSAKNVCSVVIRYIFGRMRC